MCALSYLMLFFFFLFVCIYINDASLFQIPYFIFLCFSLIVFVYVYSFHFFFLFVCVFVFVCCVLYIVYGSYGYIWASSSCFLIISSIDLQTCLCYHSLNGHFNCSRILYPCWSKIRSVVFTSLFFFSFFFPFVLYYIIILYNI